MVTFNITTSKCAGILINPCEFEAYCSLHFLRFQKEEMFLCDSYLQSFSSKQVKVVKEEKYIMMSMNLKFLKYQPDHDTCVHLYLSSDVVARFQNVFQNDFNNNPSRDPDCFVHIMIERDTVTTNNILTSIYQGSLKRTETLEFTGHGNVVNTIF